MGGPQHVELEQLQRDERGGHPGPPLPRGGGRAGGDQPEGGPVVVDREEGAHVRVREEGEVVAGGALGRGLLPVGEGVPEERTVGLVEAAQVQGGPDPGVGRSCGPQADRRGGSAQDSMACRWIAASRRSTLPCSSPVWPGRMSALSTSETRGP